MSTVRWFAFALLAALALPAEPAQAEVRALLIGIDDYVHERDLLGAVADAKDIDTALGGIGVEDRILLTDAAATHAAIASSWQALLARSAEGDTIIFTYAGHGGQEPELGAVKTEADGLNEAFLLSRFAETAPENGERLVDDDLGRWFADADARGVAVVFVADSCHAGTMTRGLDPRAELSERFSAYTVNSTFVVPAAAPPPEGQANVLFFGASLENEKTPELVIDGVHRGALSWGFARGISGLADADGDGDITRQELQAFVLPAVRQVSDSRQHPQALPRSGKDRSLVTVPKKGERRAELAPLFVGIRPAAAAGLPAFALDAETSGKAADLVLDVATGEVVSGKGDVVADHVTAQAFPSVAAKWFLIKNATLTGADRVMPLALSPDDGVYPAGATFELASAGRTQPFLTVFNMTADGRLQFLYPLKAFGDALSFAPDQVFSTPLQASPPFGADHVVVVASAEPLERLHAVLDTPDAPMDEAFVRGFFADLAATEHQIGIQGAFTKER